MLDGNAAGVDFDFSKTTGAITGIVASSTGVDLTGANIRVSRDELAFDTKSAVAPDPGSFTITDLPPGTYLVEFARYDHAPYSQSVTIAAGEVVDLGRVVLDFRGRPDIAQNGGVEVRIVNSLSDPLNGATVRVFDISTNQLVAEQSDAPTPAAPDGTRSTFVFQPLPIGTYRIEVSKGDTYRVSTRRTSVGLAVRPEVIPLYRLGQASGRVIDSFSKAELIDYDVQILRINPDGSETLVQSIPVTVDTPPTQTPEGEEIRWETAAASLTSGTYRVNVVNPPPGYRVVPDQELVPGLPDMQFVISPTDDTPLDLRDIEADRFPEVRGTILAPSLAAGVVTFAPITAGGLTVALTCPGTDGVETTVVLDSLRPTVPPGSPIPDPGLEDVGNGPALDSYFFDRITLESNDLSGDCRLTVNADGYEPSVTPVLVSPGDGSSDPLVFRNVAMIRPEIVGGTTYWLDRGVTPSRRVIAPGVTVRTQGNVVVGFEPGVTERTEPGSDPEQVLAEVALTQTGDVNGAWAFIDPRQVFGSTNYVFTKPGQFTDRIITIRLDQGGRVVTATDSATLGLDSSNPAIEVQLDGVGGVITTQVNVATIKGTPAYPGSVNLGGFQVALTGANTATAAPTLFGANAGGVQPARATFPTVDPGTHQVNVTSTAVSGTRPLFVQAGAQPPAFVQEPGTNVTVPPVTFIEQGAINVSVNDVTGTPIPGTTVNVVNASTGTNYPVALTGTPATVVQAGLPVSTTIGALTTYNVSLAPNDVLDLSTAQMSWFNENNALVRTCLLAAPGCGSITIAQGGQPPRRHPGVAPRFDQGHRARRRRRHQLRAAGAAGPDRHGPAGGAGELRRAGDARSAATGDRRGQRLPVLRTAWDLPAAVQPPGLRGDAGRRAAAGGRGHLHDPQPDVPVHPADDPEPGADRHLLPRPERRPAGARRAVLHAARPAQRVDRRGHQRLARPRTRRSRRSGHGRDRHDDAPEHGCRHHAADRRQRPGHVRPDPGRLHGGRLAGRRRRDDVLPRLVHDEPARRWARRARRGAVAADRRGDHRGRGRLEQREQPGRRARRGAGHGCVRRARPAGVRSGGRDGGHDPEPGSPPAGGRRAGPAAGHGRDAEHL